MKPALQFLEGAQPQSWQAFARGDALQGEIETRLTPWLEKVFGYHFVKVGALSAQLNTDACCIRHQVNLVHSDADLMALEKGVENHKSTAQWLVTDTDELPLQDHSVDGVLLCHALEYYHDPHHVLRDIHRALLPGGYVMISGFNPLSLVGLARTLPLKNPQSIRAGRFFTPARVKDWLSLLGFEIVADSGFMFSSFHRERQVFKFPRVQLFAEQYLSPFASAYIIVAKKRVVPLTPIRPKWRHARPQFGPAVKGAGFRNGV